MAITNKTESKHLWKHLNSLKGSSYTNNLPPVLTKDKDTITGETNIVNAFNEHFINISSFINANEFKISNFEELEKSLDSKVKHHFNIEYITPFKVNQYIKDLDVKKSTGIDGIGPNILKLCGDTISIAITSIINNSISKGIFPGKLKEACVIPIFKNGSKDDPSNYRPISILNTVSKLFEKHVSEQLLSFLTKYDILYKFQSGFRPGHSCQTALLSTIDKWMKAIDNGEVVGSVYLDLQKAFDLVDHEILIHKLKLYKFTELIVNWFASYLNCRTQVVKVGNNISNKGIIKTGVPQGSILGPLLFLIYVNDMPLSVSSSNIDMYADDTGLHKTGRNIKDVELNLQQSVDNISHWCRINNMSLNAKKSKSIIVCSKKQVKNIQPLKISLNNTIIEPVDCHNVLGVLLDNTLSWSSQVKRVCDRLNSQLYLFSKISKHLNLQIRKLYYNAYISPLFDYCSVIWGNCGKTDLNKLIRIQKRACKIALNYPKDMSYFHMCKELQILPFALRVKFQTAVQIYKILNLDTPDYLKNMFQYVTRNQYCLRSISNKTLVQVKPNTEFFKLSFRYNGCNIWNDLPLSIRSSSTLHSFQVLLKTFLYDTF